MFTLTLSLCSLSLSRTERRTVVAAENRPRNSWVRGKQDVPCALRLADLPKIWSRRQNACSLYLNNRQDVQAVPRTVCVPHLPKKQPGATRSTGNDNKPGDAAFSTTN